MEIIPAIDLLDTKCVRLMKGSFKDITTYGNPISFAKELETRGACMVHLCDLNRSKNDGNDNFAVVERILKESILDIQAVGGIKSLPAVKEYLNRGAKRVVMSAWTILTMDSRERNAIVQRYGSRVVVSIDAVGTRIARNAWREISDLDMIEAAQKIIGFGFDTLIYTDVSRDGTLSEPNYAMAQDIMGATGKPIIVAGGISLVSQIVRLKKMGVKGVIFGKALFYEKFNFEEALKLC